MSYKTLKTAADALEVLAAELEAAQRQTKVAEAKADEALAKVAQAETRQVQLAKTAAAKDEETKAKRASLAKVAADRLLDKGLLSTTEKRDQFAAELLSPDVALAKIAQLTEFVSVARLGTVVVDEEQHKTASAEDSWARHVQSASNKLGLR